MRKDWEEFKKEKQSVIFEAALKVIKEKGFHQARMSDIAEAAGVSYGLVYHYFKNKEGPCSMKSSTSGGSEFTVNFWNLFEKAKGISLKLRNLSIISWTSTR